MTPNEAKELADLLKGLRNSGKRTAEVIKAAQGVNHGATWDNLMSAQVVDKELGINMTMQDFLKQNPELETEVSQYLDKQVYGGMRGFFLNNYEKTLAAIEQVEKELSSVSVKGLDKLLVTMGKQGLKIPLLALTYVVAKPLLYIERMGAGIDGHVSGGYLSDRTAMVEDDLKLQASTLLHMLPVGGYQISELLNMTSSLEGRVQYLINDLAVIHALNIKRKEMGLSLLPVRKDLPWLVDKIYSSRTPDQSGHYAHVTMTPYLSDLSYSSHTPDLSTIVHNGHNSTIEPYGDYHPDYGGDTSPGVYEYLNQPANAYN